MCKAETTLDTYQYCYFLRTTTRTEVVLLKVRPCPIPVDSRLISNSKRPFPSVHRPPSLELHHYDPRLPLDGHLGSPKLHLTLLDLDLGSAARDRDL
jgi:hypothetical protein